MSRFADAGEAIGLDSDAVGEFASGFGRAGTTENVPLDHADAQISDQLEVIMRLDTFGARIHSERLGERNDGTNDRRVAVGRGGRSTNEALVDLDFVERRFLQIPERAVARPEIV